MSTPATVTRVAARRPGSPLTERQREVYNFIVEHVRRQGYSPTVRDIGHALGIRSPNGVICHLDALAEKGRIRRAGGLPRAIQIIRDDAAEAERIVERLRALPLERLRAIRDREFPAGG
jgi:repressor LexA